MPQVGEHVLTNSTTKKRKRRPVSCWHCRIRKVKCNRESPCDACIKSGDTATCSYVSQISNDDIGAAETVEENMLEARIDRLESLLLSVAANEKRAIRLETVGNNSGPPSPDSSNLNEISAGSDQDQDSIDELSSTLGLMKVDESGRTHYLGASHWVSVGLREITEFRTFMHQNVCDLEEEAIENHHLKVQSSIHAPSLFKGTGSIVSHDEVLAFVPPRMIADELVTRFFESQTPTTILLHQPTFYRQYARFWSDPQEAEFAWLSLLFAVFRIAEVMKEVDDFQSDLDADHFDFLKAYKNLTIQCLIAADYAHTATTTTLKSMLLYIESEIYLSYEQATATEIDLVLGLVTRLAMRMGLHREWKDFKGLTPFETEMRRRLWACIRCIHIMYSFQLSLPSTIRQEDCDCASPRNLRDEDFGEDSAVLPPARPQTDVTKASYIIAKSQLVFVIDQIIKVTEHKGSRIKREEVRLLEDAMLSSQKAIPPHLQLAFATKSAPIPVRLKRQRMQLDRLGQTAKCVLYRGFLSRAHQDEKLMHYRRSCIDASLSLLRTQAEIYLSWGACTASPMSIRKRHLFTLTSHDFFIAGMVIAVDLHFGVEAEPQTPKASDIRLWGLDRRVEMMEALEKSIEFWRIAKSDSVEAAKAWGLFSFSLNNAKRILTLNRPSESRNTPGPESIPTMVSIDQNSSKGLFDSTDTDLKIDWALWDEWTTNSLYNEFAD